MTVNSQPTPTPKKSKTVLVVVAAVIVVVVVAALLLVGMGGITNGSTAGQIKNGSYLDYSGTGTTATGQQLAGSVTISFNNVTSANYTMRESITINGQTTNLSQIVNSSTESWVTSTGSGSLNESAKLIGQQTLQTNFGQKTTNHYSENFSGYLYEFWEDSSNGVLYEMKFTYTDGGEFTCMLTSTNML